MWMFYTMTMDDLIAPFMMFIGVVVISVIVFSNLPEKVYFDRFNETKVHSTAGNYNNIEGRFFLGSGYINSTEMYSTNFLEEDGAYTRFYIPVAKTKRYVKNSLTDFAIYKRPICKKEPTWLWTDNNSFECSRSIQMGELYIPKGTIIKKLNFQ